MLTSQSTSLGTFVSISTSAYNSYTMYTVPAGKNLYVTYASGVYMTGFYINNGSGGGYSSVDVPLYVSQPTDQYVLPAGTVLKQDGSSVRGVLVGYVR